MLNIPAWLTIILLLVVETHISLVVSALLLCLSFEVVLFMSVCILALNTTSVITKKSRLL